MADTASNPKPMSEADVDIDIPKTEELIGTATATFSGGRSEGAEAGQDGEDVDIAEIVGEGDAHLAKIVDYEYKDIPSTKISVLSRRRPSIRKEHLEQDISHIVIHEFKKLFHDEETILPGDTEMPLHEHDLISAPPTVLHYHKKYQQLEGKFKGELAEIHRVREHINHARDTSENADNAELERSEKILPGYGKMNIPLGKSKVKENLSQDLLEKQGYLFPDADKHVESVYWQSKKSSIPGYQRGTINSQKNAQTRKRTQTKRDSKRVGQPSKYPKEMFLESMHATHRAEERKRLSDMNRRTDYLQNPRHLALTVLPEIKPKIQKTSYTQIFVPIPSTVSFTNYTVGNFYELSLKLENISVLSRRVRIIPPASPFFSVSLGKFPTQDGNVAPGMFCEYKVRFAPDSLANYKDSITVITEGGLELKVPLEATRPAPCLSLSPLLDCTYCLVKDNLTVKFVCTNMGGDGKFAFIRNKDWPTSVFPYGDKIYADPFVISPSCFELKANETINLEIKFSPTKKHSYKEKVKLVCDNCTVRSFDILGTGEMPVLEFQSDDTETLNPVDMYLQDIDFKGVNPMTTMKRSIQVLNKSSIRFPYKWVCYEALPKALKGADGDCSTPEGIELSSPFTISPASGVLEPLTCHNLEISFTPPEMENYAFIAKLYLEDIPNIEADADLDTIDEVEFKNVEKLKLNLLGYGQEFDMYLTPPLLFMPGEIPVGRVCEKHIGLCNNSSNPAPFEIFTVVQGDPESCSVTVTPQNGVVDGNSEFALMIEYLPHTYGQIDILVEFHIPFSKTLMLPTKLMVAGNKLSIDTSDLNFGLAQLGEQIESNIPIQNNSEIPISWSIKPVYDRVQEANPNYSEGLLDKQFIFSPDSGVLGPGEKGVVSTTFAPTYCHINRTVLEVSVTQGESCFIQASGDGQIPKISLLESAIDLGTVYKRVPHRHTFKMINLTRLEAEFKWEDVENTKFKLLFEPNSAILADSEETEVTLTFTPLSLGIFENILLSCSVKGNPDEIGISLSAACRGLQLHYTTEKLEQNIPKMPKTISDTLYIKRKSAHPPEDTVSSRISPVKSRVESVSPEFVAPTPDLTEKPDLVVEELDPFAVHISSVEPDILLDFGISKIFSSTTKSLFIRNDSGIPAKFKISVDTFGAASTNGDKREHLLKPPEAATSKIPSYLKKRRTLKKVLRPMKQLLSETNEQQMFNSEDGQMFAETRCEARGKLGKEKALLARRLGVAFDIDRSEGFLNPFGVTEIKVTCYSDMWGVYNDRLMCEIEEIDPVYIPITVSTVGCPISFQLSPAKSDNVEHLAQYGTFIPKISPVNRNIRVLNKSPFNIPLEWKVYNNEQDKSKVVDVRIDVREDDSGELISKLKIEKHEGNPSNVPYTVSPSKMVVPAFGGAPVVVSFRAEEEGSFNGFIESELFLNYAKGPTPVFGSGLSYRHDVPGTGIVHRAIGFDNDYKIRLDLRARAIKARLHADLDEDDMITYICTAGELSRGPKTCIKTFNLINTEAATVSLTIGTSAPFFISKIDPSPGVEVILETNPTTGQEDEVYIIPPNENLELTLIFNSYPKQLDRSIYERCPGDDSLEQVRISGELKLHFRNNTLQLLPIQAIIYIPTLDISATEFSFPTCLVDCSKINFMSIANPSLSDGIWAIEHVPRSVEELGEIEAGLSLREQKGVRDDPRVFSFSPSSGMIKGTGRTNVRSAQTIEITFTPKDNVVYYSVMRIYVAHGPSIDIHLTGKASCDEYLDKNILEYY
eukprot:Nk52_evm18s304 gene=Nk52_evmTU18s304